LLSLRERLDDIPLLVEYFIDRYAKKAGKNFSNMTNKTFQLFQAYDVREYSRATGRNTDSRREVGNFPKYGKMFSSKCGVFSTLPNGAKFAPVKRR
jgi:hypothetical protein